MWKLSASSNVMDFLNDRYFYQHIIHILVMKHFLQYFNWFLTTLICNSDNYQITKVSSKEFSFKPFHILIRDGLKSKFSKN